VTSGQQADHRLPNDIALAFHHRTYLALETSDQICGDSFVGGGGGALARCH
jgi:hypothetical protein